MLLILLQMDMFTEFQLRFTDFLLYIILPIFIISGIIALKIGLTIAKAEVWRGMKFCALSFVIQLGVILFIASPLILFGFAGEMEGAPPIALIMVFLVLALFIDIQVINVIHKLGLKRAILVFIIMMIPVGILGVISGIVASTGVPI